MKTPTDTIEVTVTFTVRIPRELGLRELEEIAAEVWDDGLSEARVRVKELELDATNFVATEYR